MSNVVIYARFSSNKQREESIEGQIRVCKKYAEEHDMKVIREYCDRAETGTTFEARAEAMKMVKDSRKKDFTAVLIWKFDRFSRDEADFYKYKKELQSNGVRLISVTEDVGDTAQGALMTGIHTAMNAYYSKELAEKVDRGMTENALKGLSNGGYRTFGYDIKEQKYVKNIKEAFVVKNAFKMYADGFSVKDILEFCNAGGYKTPQGKKFTHDFLNRMLKNCKYKGVQKWNDIEFKEGIEAIVSDELFDKVQKRLAENSNTGARNNAKTTYALIGKVFCGKCAQPMVADSVKKAKSKKSAVGINQYFSVASLNAIIEAVDNSTYIEETDENYTTYHYYVCRGRKQKAYKNGCDKERVEKDLLENAVIKYTTEKYLCDENINRLAKATLKLNKKQKNKTVQKTLKKKIKDEQTKIDNLYEMVEAGFIGEQTYQRIQQAENRKKDLESQLENWNISNKDLSFDDIVNNLKNVRSKMQKFIKNGKIPTEVKKEFCQTFIEAVYVYDEDDNGGRRLKIIFDELQTEGLSGFNEADIDFSSTIDSYGSPNRDCRIAVSIFLFYKAEYNIKRIELFVHLLRLHNFIFFGMVFILYMVVRNIISI